MDAARNEELAHAPHSAAAVCDSVRCYSDETACKVPFTVLTFNVYPGPPVPYSGPDLFPRRIAAQIQALRRVDADIVCLQELYCVKSFAALQNAFPDYDCRWNSAATAAASTPSGFGNDAHPRRRRPVPVPLSPFGTCLAAVLIGLCWLSVCVPAPVACVAALLLLAIYLLLPRDCGLLAWLSNGGTGLAIMVRRTRATVVRHETRKFAHQRGDPLNFVAPRGYTRTKLHMKSACSCGGSACFMTVYNTHLNAPGNSKKHRASQADELGRQVTLTPPKHKLIVCGDFNEAPNCDSAVREVIEIACRLANADPSMAPTFCPTRNPLAAWCTQAADACIDCIYFQAGALRGLVTDAPTRVVFADAKPDLSDHYGVLASFH